jgi:hypothetical protein
MFGTPAWGWGTDPTGKWLNLLRENANVPADRTDKTDKTATAGVLSVLSARPHGVSKLTPLKMVGSVSFVSSASVPFPDFGSFDNRSGWDDEDWQIAFDERAATLKFDQGLPREAAEMLARQQIEAERKRWLQ